jgi:uncharacterized protein YbbC (DUF1343 family)
MRKGLREACDRRQVDGVVPELPEDGKKKGKMARTMTGLQVFLEENAGDCRGKSLGLLANQASVGPCRTHASRLLEERLPGRLKALFSPQHGIYGEKQDNMIASESFVREDGLPVHSLYGDTRQPDGAMLDGLDAVLCDLTDVGARVYTFAHTLSLFMEKASERGLEVVVLDRPNPIGGVEVEGNLLDDDCRSFVGLHPIPMRHGLTMGELALYINSRLRRPARLTVSPMRGWERASHFQDTGLPWVMPSPNMPSPLTAEIYPGSVLFEGTMLSEGRGTTLPFHLVGAPFINPGALKKDLDSLGLPDVSFREASFQPCFHKWCGQVCGGVEIHPLGRGFKPYLTALSILEVVLRRWPDDFQLKDPPYEYEHERRPIDLITGRRSVFDSLKGGASARELAEGFEPELDKWRRAIKDFLLYR